MTITYRRATHADSFNLFLIFRRSIEDFSQRAGVMAITGGRDPEKMKQLWERRRPLWEHLTDTSDQFWMAENENGEAIGYARSILRGEHRELTEFFVLPENQSAGVGRELIARAFPNDAPQRTIVGYGYIERDYYGPFALLDNKDFPAVLAHAETQAHALGAPAVGFEIPTVNVVAVEYALSRGYRLEGFIASIMANKPFGKFENYILSSPPFFL